MEVILAAKMLVLSIPILIIAGGLLWLYFVLN